ncbi:hypothetical protein CN373_10495 [Bacillus cereus]|nr:hypothetical protein CN373_10495 [Bacillus cereus]PGZ12557.1 hypothetical protein COE46_23505 [Bacillus cereus]
MVLFVYGKFIVQKTEYIYLYGWKLLNEIMQEMRIYTVKGILILKCPTFLQMKIEKLAFSLLHFALCATLNLSEVPSLLMV